MFRWTPFPLVRITIILCVSILIGIYNSDLLNGETGAVVWVIIFTVTVISYLVRRKSILFKYLLWMGCVVTLFVSGIVVVRARTETNKDNHLMHLNDSILAYEALIIDHLEERQNSFKTTISIQKVKTRSGWREVSGKVNLYISKAGYSENLIWGDHILAHGSPQETTPPGNPNEFDYKRFLTFNNVYHQHYVRQGEWFKLPESEISFKRYSSIARNYFSGVIKKYVSGKHEQGVAMALIIGVKDGIDNDLIGAYSASGAMHVLAVSGLHVGIIYWMLLAVLKPLQKQKSGKWIVSMVCLCVLWSYAFVTGLSPSVLRAVTMFSFVCIARAVNQRTNIYNTLASSAFILLIWNPFLIMSVGFQLSYLAVIGIIWVQRPLYRLWEPSNAMVNWVWGISCVSIAAQATTFSLGLLYFHQFPTYFLFSNLIVIPAATFVLILGVVLMLVSWIGPIASLVGWLLEKTSWILNWSVFVIEDLPFSIASDIYLNVYQAWLILGMLVSFVFIFQFKKIHWFYISILLTISFSIARWLHYVDRMDSPQLIVYNVSGSTAVEILKRGHSVFLADSALLADKEKIRFHISGNRLFNLIRSTDSHVIKKTTGTSQAFCLGNKTILFINRSIQELSHSVKPDLIVVNQEGAWSVNQLQRLYPDATIVLDGTCNSFLIAGIKSRAKGSNRIYSVTASGAYIQTL